jgi:hypothetical protein
MYTILLVIFISGGLELMLLMLIVFIGLGCI